MRSINEEKTICKQSEIIIVNAVNELYRYNLTFYINKTKKWSFNLKYKTIL